MGRKLSGRYKNGNQLVSCSDGKKRVIQVNKTGWITNPDITSVNGWIPDPYALEIYGTVEVNDGTRRIRVSGYATRKDTISEWKFYPLEEGKNFHALPPWSDITSDIMEGNNSASAIAGDLDAAPGDFIPGISREQLASLVDAPRIPYTQTD